MADCFVYIIARKLDDSWSAPIKVGLSNSPGNRLEAFQTASPFKIDIFQVARLPDRETANEIEQAFHQMMERYRLHGEWFDMTPENALNELALGIAAYVKVRMGLDWEGMQAATHKVFGGRVVLTQ